MLRGCQGITVKQCSRSGVFAATLTAMLFGACAPLRSSRDDLGTTVPSWASTDPSRIIVSDSITLWFFAPREVRTGEPVPMRVELENTRPGWMDISLGGRAPHADFVVSDAAGRQVWSVYHGLIPLGNEDLRRLDTNERLVFPFVWNQESGGLARAGPRVPAGDYTVRARVRLGGNTVETPRRSLRIVGS